MRERNPKRNWAERMQPAKRTTCQFFETWTEFAENSHLPDERLLPNAERVWDEAHFHALSTWAHFGLGLGSDAALDKAPSLHMLHSLGHLDVVARRSRRIAILRGPPKNILKLVWLLHVLCAVLTSDINTTEASILVISPTSPSSSPFDVIGFAQEIQDL